MSLLLFFAYLVYMYSVFKNGKKEEEEIKEKMDNYAKYRREKQPIEYPNAGSTFKRGKDFIKKQFEKSCDAKTFAQKMQYENHKIGDVIVLSGVGKVFPFMRVHALLEAMQPLFNDVPILVFYPGEFDGHYVKLFNKLKANEYYRAFKSI